MDTWSNEHPNRRAFLQRAAALGGLGAAAPLVINLAAFGEAAAFTATLMARSRADSGLVPMIRAIAA